MILTQNFVIYLKFWRKKSIKKYVILQNSSFCNKITFFKWKKRFWRRKKAFPGHLRDVSSAPWLLFAGSGPEPPQLAPLTVEGPHLCSKFLPNRRGSHHDPPWGANSFQILLSVISIFKAPSTIYNDNLSSNHVTVLTGFILPTKSSRCFSCIWLIKMKVKSAIPDCVTLILKSVSTENKNSV